MELVTANEMLPAIRGLLEWADDALFCVAYASVGGIHLIHDEVEYLLKRKGELRIVSTTALTRETGPALSLAASIGAIPRSLNLVRGTYHAKLYLGRDSARTKARAIIGSANLTGGLDGKNLEVAVLQEGPLSSGSVLSRAWEHGVNIWNHDRAKTWVGQDHLGIRGTWSPFLRSRLESLIPAGTDLHTLDPTRKSKNGVLSYEPMGVRIRTPETIRKNRPHGELVPAEMFAVVWEHLLSNGEVTSREAQSPTGLRVMRSSFVLAALSHFPEVKHDTEFRYPDTGRRGVRLLLKPAARKAPR